MGRFIRTRPAPEVQGEVRYGKYRLFVQADFEHCCAYCYFHEFYVTGTLGDGVFEIDHFWPKRPFDAKEDDFYNLYWSCRICNGAKNKGRRYPNEELQAAGIGFVDLCKDTFEDHYTVEPDGRLQAKSLSGSYTIKYLRLNERNNPIDGDLVGKRHELKEKGHRMDVPPPAGLL